MRIFLAYPFTKLLDADGNFHESAKHFITNAVKRLEERGHSVFSAQVREVFGEELMEPDLATRLDYQEMGNADLVVAFPGWAPISGGVHVELGWASAKGKPILLFLHEDESYTPMVTGLGMVTQVKPILFGDADMDRLVDQILEEVDQYTLHYT
ncbi:MULTISPECIES: nucleoside 2-deoxyribosyltransferase [Paenibacillus]|uniref:Nucleoside 2-deoxyribosyltransferase n=1 Tax=Paenibacillus oleatilyticus TaxID=2594886 RepID=A0ABV4V0C4_9BACL|nr:MULTISPECIES: nucleoside 2-deoxyribosyltransferase [Paenibacillus]MBU7315050.1 nucleoside 2-deoxyribosyltransferase [Paenibacillus oleatilyticus]